MSIQMGQRRSGGANSRDGCMPSTESDSRSRPIDRSEMLLGQASADRSGRSQAAALATRAGWVTAP